MYLIWVWGCGVCILNVSAQSAVDVVFVHIYTYTIAINNMVTYYDGLFGYKFEWFITLLMIFNSNNSVSGSICASDEHNFTILIQLDQWPYETFWNLTTVENKNISLLNDRYTATSELDIVSDSICIIGGCYIFYIYDTYGDGIDDGWYEILIDKNTWHYENLDRNELQHPDDAGKIPLSTFEFCTSGNHTIEINLWFSNEFDSNIARQEWKFIDNTNNLVVFSRSALLGDLNTLHDNNTFLVDNGCYTLEFIEEYYDFINYFTIIVDSNLASFGGIYGINQYDNSVCTQRLNCIDSNTFECNGIFIDTSLMKSDILAKNYQSYLGAILVNTEDDTTYDQIYCYGANSCKNLLIVSKYDSRTHQLLNYIHWYNVDCFGFGSCINQTVENGFLSCKAGFGCLSSNMMYHTYLSSSSLQ